MSATAAPTPEQRLERLATASPAITIAHVSKSFRLPHRQFSTLKERVLHPRTANTYDTLHAVTDVDLNILSGEFFGIVGRNGSGKSTLLKCLAGIYDVDHGEIEVHGRLSPFIELGVGFNPELTARDNVIINAIMLGLSPREARERFAEIIAFAELEEFLDLRLKNYSSGMAVRLAFSVAIQVDAEVLLVDEVLAVGDLAFQMKCYDAFQRLKEAGKTIVFVTHDMGMVERFCDRAMLLERGDVVDIGDPARVARKYNELNFGRPARPGDGSDERFGDQRAAEIRAGWFENGDGERIESLPAGDPCRFCVEVAFHQDVDDPVVGVTLRNQPGHAIFSTTTGQTLGALGHFAAGEVITLRLRFDNHLAPSIYSATPVITHSAGADAYDLRENLTSLIIFGANPGGGVALLPHEFEIERG